MLQPKEVSARSQQSAYAETGDMSSICAPCAGPVRIEARYDDPWQTPVTGALVRIEDQNGTAVVPGIPGGPTTLGLVNFGAEDGLPVVPSLRTDTGSFEHPEIARGGVAVALVPEPDAQATIEDLESQILADLRAFAQQMQTALQPWINEWKDSGWWGVLGTFFEAVQNGLVSWWEGEGDFWASAWEAITNVPDVVIEGIQAAGDAAVALWNNKDRIFELMQAFAEGSIEQIENLMTMLADAFRNIPGLEEVAGLFIDLVENSVEWAGSMIEMATQTRVLSVLFMTMGGAILMAPPNFWAEAVGTLGGYLIPEIIIAIIFAVIAFFTAGTGGAGLAARIALFVSKMTTKLSQAGPVGRIVLHVFSKLAGLTDKIKDLVRALKRNITELRHGATDTTTDIVRQSSRRVPPKRENFHNPDLDDEWYNPDTGELDWPPNNGFNGAPVNDTLQPGTRLDRYSGSTGLNDRGKFLSPQGATFESRALPYNPATQNYSVYEVVKPFSVQSGQAAPWFNQSGGATQYFTGETGVRDLIRDGYIRQVQ